MIHISVVHSTVAHAAVVHVCVIHYGVIVVFVRLIAMVGTNVVVESEASKRWSSVLI